MADRCKQDDTEDAEEMGRALYMYLSEVPPASALLPMLMQISTGKQLADIVTVHSPKFAPDASS